VDARDLILGLQRSGRLEEARQAAREAASKAPQRFDIAILQGDLAAQAEQWAEAAGAYARAAVARPDMAEVQANLSLYRWRAGQLAEAETAARKAIQLKSGLAAAHLCLGNTLASQRRYSESIAAFREAVHLAPGNADALNNLGRQLADSGDAAGMTEALAVLRTAQIAHPTHQPILLNLVELLKSANLTDEAMDRLDAGAAAGLAGPQLHWSRGAVLWQAGRMDEAVDAFRAAMLAAPDSAAMASNYLFALQFDARLSPAEILGEHREHWKRVGPVEPLHLDAVAPSMGVRLRLGYVTSDLCEHPVARFMEPVLANHDRERVEVFVFSSVKQPDAVTARMQQSVEHWVDCRGLDDQALAHHIASLGIQVLVDLSGHTGGNRLMTFARRPAPVQVAWLGYPGTTGLEAIAYRLSDAICDPQGFDAHYAEKLVRLSGPLCCFDPGESPAVATRSIPQSGGVLFGSFNHVNKLGAPVIAAWSEILRALPASRLRLLTVPEGRARDRLAAAFAAQGVDPARLEFLNKMPRQQFLAALSEVDIALDPFPMNGGTTTLETLWMGVPVITLAGDRYCSRVGASFLDFAGMGDWIAQDKDAYVRTAVVHANDPQQLGVLRSSLRDQLSRSPLLDARGFTRGLEETFLSLRSGDSTRH